MNLFSLLNAPADTGAYYIAGYVVFFTVMVLYLASMVIRSRNLQSEYELLVEADEDE